MSGEPEIWTCPECGATLDIARLGFYAPVVCSSCGHEEHVHTLLANFRLEGILGVGGMSVVLRARDLVLGRPLAIKVLNDTYRDKPERIARFERECALMAKVRHSHVVSLYSAGWARGQFYIAMELVEGENLELSVGKGKTLEPLRALELIRQAALGLQAASKAGMLHRDMKPGNILINQEGEAKVLDFGLSVDNRDEEEEEMIWATPFYVAPETLRREEEDVRTDIYSLGMTLRNLLTGEDSFGTTPSSVADLLQSKRKLPRLSAVCPGIDEAVSDLVDHMTTFNPRYRTPGYEVLLQELDEAREVLLHPSRLRLTRKLRRCLYGAAAVMVIFLGGELAWLIRPTGEEDAVSPEAVPVLDHLAAVETAKQKLSVQEWEEAMAVLKRISADRAAEPLVAAYAALQVAGLHAMQGASPDDVQMDLQKWGDCLARVAEENQPSPLLQEMRTLATLLIQPAPQGVHLESSQPDLKVLYHYLYASALAGTGQVQAAASWESEGGRLAQETVPVFVPLVQARMSQQPMPEEMGDLPESLARQMRLGQLDQALAGLEQRMENRALSSQMREKSRVLREVCLVARDAYAMLRRHCPVFRPDMPPQEVRRLAASLGKEHLEQELFALSLILHGEAEAAFKADPYASDPQSRAPFAVLMRDWKKRYGQ